MSPRGMRGAVLLALLAAAGCGRAEPEAPPPDPVARPGHPVIPVEGKPVRVSRVRPAGFEWPGGVTVTSPGPGTVAVDYTLDNPCRHVPSGAQSTLRGDTVALVVRWPRVDPDSSRKCPPDVSPDAYRMELYGVPSGRRTFGMFEAIEGQTAAALSHTMEVTVQ